MSSPQPKTRTSTLADWATWEGRWEIIQGIPYDMTPAPSPEHQRASMALSLAIGNALLDARRKHGGACEVMAAPIDLFLPGDPGSVYQPDLVIVCDPTKITQRGIEGVPELVVEILSPSTAGKDVTRKRWAYEAAGVPEYLIVDPSERVGLLLRLHEGRYEEAARVEWGAVVALLDGKVPVTLEPPPPL
jgi:Uma2 family endonuclease